MSKYWIHLIYCTLNHGKLSLHVRTPPSPPHAQTDHARTLHRRPTWMPSCRRCAMLPFSSLFSTKSIASFVDVYVCTWALPRCIRFECVSCLMTSLIESSQPIHKHVVTCLSARFVVKMVYDFQLMRCGKSANKTWANWFSLLSFVLCRMHHHHAAMFASDAWCGVCAKSANKVRKNAQPFVNDLFI